MTHAVYRTFAGGLLFFLSIPFVRASERMRPANVIESGKFALSVYGVHGGHEDLEFNFRGASLIQVPLQGGATAQFFSDTNTDIQFQGELCATVLRLTWRPASGLQYGLKLGAGDYELEIPSRTVTNRLENGSPGRLWGFDASWNLITDTPVTPAIAVSLGYTRFDFDINRLQSGSAAPVAVNQRFALQEWQAAASASKRWGRWEPYGGLKILRQWSTLKDLTSADKVRGVRDGVAPFAGLKWEFLPRESLVVEASAVDETLLALGLAVGF